MKTENEMNKNVVQQPTDSELEILSVLWENGPSTVRFVNDKLNKKRKIGYTTTLKIMQIMYDKKLLIRNEEGRSHIYLPQIEENAIQNRLIDKILDTAFKGSASSLIMQTLGNHTTTRKELDEIRKMIDEIDNTH